MGKRKMAETDSDDSDGDSESDDSDAENEKSAVTDNGSQSDSSKDASNDSISVPQFAGDNKGRGTSNSNSEEEKETPPSIAVETDANQMESSIQSSGDGHVETSSDTDEKMLEKPCVPPEVAPATVQCISDQMPNTFDFVHEDSECKTTAPKEVVVGSSIVSDVPKPLNSLIYFVTNVYIK